MFVGFVTQLCSLSNAYVWSVDICRVHYYSEDTQQTMYLVDTSPELLLTDELSLVDKTFLSSPAGKIKVSQLYKWVLNRISTPVFIQQLQYHTHTYVHCICSHPIRLGNRLRGYNMIGYGVHQVKSFSLPFSVPWKIKVIEFFCC